MNWKIGCGVMVMVSLISIVYAYVQTVKAQVAESEALKQKELIERVVEESSQARAEAEKNAARWETAIKEMEELRKKCK